MQIGWLWAELTRQVANSARRVDEYADNVAACEAKSRRTQHMSRVVGVARQYATRYTGRRLLMLMKN